MSLPSGDRAVIGLREAADRLGVHYMTAYRYVRTGQLTAVKEGGEWRILLEDLPTLHESAKVVERDGPPRARARARERLEGRLVAGDELGAWGVVEVALASGADPAEIHLGLLAPALCSIGERWAAGELSVADEHRASAVARRIVGRLGARFVRRGRKRATVIVGAPTGERHELPVCIVTDLLREARFEVIDLGADTPAASFAEVAERHRPLAVLVGVTGDGHGPAVRATVRAVSLAAGGPPRCWSGVRPSPARRWRSRSGPPGGPALMPAAWWPPWSLCSRPGARLVARVGTEADPVRAGARASLARRAWREGSGRR